MEVLTAIEWKRVVGLVTQSWNILGSLCEFATESLCSSAPESKLRQKAVCYFLLFLFVCLFVCFSQSIFPVGTILLTSTSGQMLNYRGSETQIISTNIMLQLFWQHKFPRNKKGKSAEKQFSHKCMKVIAVINYRLYNIVQYYFENAYMLTKAVY